MKSDATDFDILVGRGFEPAQVRKALSLSQGDLKKAMLVLSKNLEPSEAAGWSTNTDADWVNHVSNNNPVRAENRALWKSPIYVRVGSYRRMDDETIFFVLHVIMKDGRQHERTKRLSHFNAFYDSLPRGLFGDFKNKFPKRTLIPWKNKSESIEKKRALLEEWMRELCMNEVCMSNREVLGALLRFLEVEEAPPARGVTNEADPAARVVKLSDYKEDWIAVPEKSLSRVPVPFHTLSGGMPFKVRVGTVFSSDADQAMLAGLLEGGTDTSDAQLSKDLFRDRIIINGRRIVGAASKPKEGEGGDALQALHDILAVAEDMATAVLVASGFRDSFSDENIRSICLRALKKASRTYSAFLCHTALHKIVDLESAPEVCIVPESLLAMPLVMRFAVSTPPVSYAPPVLRCELQAATVYRFCSGEDLNTEFQCKTVFCKTFREMATRKESPKAIKCPPSVATLALASKPPPPACESSPIAAGSPSDLEVAGYTMPAPIPVSCSTPPRSAQRISPMSPGSSRSSAPPSPVTPPPPENGSPSLKYKAAFSGMNLSPDSDTESSSDTGNPVAVPRDLKAVKRKSFEPFKRGEHDSEAFIVLVKETSTTSRDWGERAARNAQL